MELFPGDKITHALPSGERVHIKLSDIEISWDLPEAFLEIEYENTKQVHSEIAEEGVIVDLGENEGLAVQRLKGSLQGSFVSKDAGL